MVMPIEIDSPRTDFGNATFASTQLPDFSIEPSFISPPRELQNRVDNLSKSRQNRPKSNNLATPGTRNPLIDRRNAPTGAQRAEFTPLLKSVVKSNFTKAKNVASRVDGVPPTPAVLKPGYLSNLNSPTLPMESTGINGDTDHSYVPEDSTMQPPGPGSSASTPLAMLPSSNHGGVVLDGQNVMSLREQENIVNKIEKENFGLKLKIHFLEDALKRAGPGVSQAALRENTDLKVEKVTLQKELLRYRKALGAVEQDLEAYKQQLDEAQRKTVRGRGDDSQQREEISKLSNALRHAEAEVQKLGEKLKAVEDREGATNDEQRRELLQLRQELQGAEVEIQNLNDQLRSARSNEADADQIADELDDLKAELREKERMLGEKDDQLDDFKEELAALRSRTGHNNEIVEEKDAELAALKDDISLLKSDVKRKEALLQEKEGEVNDLKDEIVVLQSSLDEDSEQARQEISTAREEIELLQSRLQSLTRERDDQANQMRSHQGIQTLYEACEKERDMLRKQLQIYHDNEAQNEASQKERSMLKQELQDIQRQKNIHDQERAVLRKELEDAQVQLRAYERESNLLKRELQDTRTQNEVYENERGALRKDLYSGQAQNEVYEKERDSLKKQLAERRQHEVTQAQEIEAMELMIIELRDNVSQLEKQLQEARGANKHDQGHIQERRELREQLKKANREMEEQQVQISQQEQHIEALTREKRELRSQLRKAGDERDVLSQKSIRARTDLDCLRKQYEMAVSKVTELERRLAEETRSLQRVRHDQEKQHHGELKGLSKQIMFLRKRCARESRFRADLAFVKKYFLMQAEMYNACNHAGLQMLEEMGIVPDQSIREKRPSLKSVIIVVISILRMKRLKNEWAQQVKIKQRLIASAAQVRGR